MIIEAGNGGLASMNIYGLRFSIVWQSSGLKDLICCGKLVVVKYLAISLFEGLMFRTTNIEHNLWYRNQETIPPNLHLNLF